MKRISSLLILVVLVSLIEQNSCSGASTINPFPLGTIGCLISDVCGSGEICTNDLLFGSCFDIYTQSRDDENRFQLTKKEIGRLEMEIRKLIRDGFTWKDAFTQCTIQNTLLEFSRGRFFNRVLCEDALGIVSPELTEAENEEIEALLMRLLSNGDINYMGVVAPSDEENTGLDLVNSNKRDEIVQVHKYFDKSKAHAKRDPYFDESNIPSNTYQEYSSREGQDPEILYYPDESPRLEAESQQQPFPYFYSSPDSEEAQETAPPQDNQDSQIELTERLPDYPDLPISFDDYPTELDEPRANLVEDGSTPDNVIQDTGISPDDEKTLEALLEGSISPESLDKAQQKRLQVFIEGLIKVLDDDGNLPDETSPSEEVKSPFGMDAPDYINDNIHHQDNGLLEPITEAYDFDSGPGNPEDAPLAAYQEDINPQVSPEPELDEADMAVDKKNIGLDVDDSLPDETNVPEVLQEPKEASTIDPHAMVMELSKEVNTTTGIIFVQNLTRLLKLEPGFIKFIRVGPERFISLEIDTDSDGKLNPEEIAREAVSDQVNDKLDAMSGGIHIITVGIGKDGNRVEVKQNNKYVVLMFILVGSIAGVVLAVVTIYLIKRHARSKKKFAQLANNPDGTEASKDYQDLCRQHMQGKTSEKPEPLHAASRIGSVSESQARSPSSRSSTSSWSEEPAAANMDISTGHIVLAYMEDHLKNQDRLDKEWEAVSSYVADPSSTKIASDAPNTRKNRYADILPYDHSHVVLSSNANVANSDYINASFITDHDPRNPAYISTQGPLPHTVADFWQMIWEQGSVVIVMLTKLTENGTSLCHRYWPEEGSDLYHIYEVHLVSEHIWCDDYLVRSFYLKNLQTNETRTVTQFHFLTWPQLSVPASIKALLDFRRKVNKSFRGRSCPIVVHCSDGCGRSGTYCLIDMVLNKMAKGAKEIDMAATLEHIRDQRMSMVKTKEQFQFSLAAVAEEVHAILKALPQ